MLANDKAPGGTAVPPGAFRFAEVLELTSDGAEGAAEVGTDGAHHGHRGDGDQRSDQTILDRGCSVLVPQELQDAREHFKRPPRGLTGG